MLQDIEIENFRCFEKTRISGFTVEYSDIAAYLEMTRAAKNNQIIEIKRDLETVNVVNVGWAE